MGEQRGQRSGPTRPSRAPRRAAQPRARLVVFVAIGICLLAVMATLASSGEDEPPKNGQAAAERADEQQGKSKDEDGTAAASETKPTKATYKVRAGDSFASIAEEVGVSVEELQQLNPDVDPRALQPGEKLKLR